MTKYMPVEKAPKAAKHKREKQTETPQMRRPEPYEKPGRKTRS